MARTVVVVAPHRPTRLLGNAEQVNHRRGHAACSPSPYTLRMAAATSAFLVRHVSNWARCSTRATAGVSLRARMFVGSGAGAAIRLSLHDNMRTCLRTPGPT